jgi:hypothetical protein
MNPLTTEQCFALLRREIVYQAMRDLMLTGEATGDERTEAREWLFSDAKRDGSFLWACWDAGLDPEAVRAEVRARETKCP